jgi:hypothetical protein
MRTGSVDREPHKHFLRIASKSRLRFSLEAWARNRQFKVPDRSRNFLQITDEPR